MGFKWSEVQILSPRQQALSRQEVARAFLLVARPPTAQELRRLRSGCLPVRPRPHGPGQRRAHRWTRCPTASRCRMPGNRSAPPIGCGAALCCVAHWPSLVAVAILVANGHGLKARYPCWLTGKLSDLAGLYFAPYLFLTTALAIAWPAQAVGERGRGTPLCPGRLRPRRGPASGALRGGGWCSPCSSRRPISWSTG